jgi:hypothetical protein
MVAWGRPGAAGVQDPGAVSNGPGQRPEPDENPARRPPRRKSAFREVKGECTEIGCVAQRERGDRLQRRQPGPGLTGEVKGVGEIERRRRTGQAQRTRPDADEPAGSRIALQHPRLERARRGCEPDVVVDGRVELGSDVRAGGGQDADVELAALVQQGTGDGREDKGSVRRVRCGHGHGLPARALGMRIPEVRAKRPVGSVRRRWRSGRACSRWAGRRQRGGG